MCSAQGGEREGGSGNGDVEEVIKYNVSCAAQVMIANEEGGWDDRRMGEVIIRCRNIRDKIKK